jgi:N-acetyl-anhydromuramyl-L-alanine amidase AmpD
MMGVFPLFSRNASQSGFQEPVPVPVPTKMRPWRYIVIHHSGASSGNALIIESGHLQRGMENGMAYHFLVGNGTSGMADGEVAEGRRWKYQLQGGHCHQDYMNDYGIGICLIGRLDRKEPTQKQLKAVVQLAYRLQGEFHIPDDNIHGHGEFYGEDSDCPGKMFPWKTFWEQMNSLFRSRNMQGVEDATAAER